MMTNQDNTSNVQVTAADMNAVIQSDPLVAERLKNVALIRMLGEAHDKIAELKAQVAKLNGTSEEPVPEAEAPRAKARK